MFQLFKGSFYFCDGPHIENVKTRADCEADRRNKWLNRKYNFDDLGQALMSLFVLSSRDGWVNIMYTGLDAVGLDMQVLSLSLTYSRSKCKVHTKFTSSYALP